MLRYGEICVSSITLAELRCGVVKSQQRSKNKDRLERFLARFEDRDFDQRAAAAYGEVRAQLEAQGTPIGPLDTLLAAHAISLGATMVTDNIREFSRVTGLVVENWVGAHLA
ncbi:MAG: PIN domain-containing protein [Proteobacteria bacterium]|nr:PIN domain-containing protein [Pseudomonadota bacterium]